LTSDAPHMFPRTCGSEFAKSAVIIRAFHSPLFGVSIQAFVARGTIPVLCKPPAFWHTPQVVFVQKFACIAFLAEASQPMFADGSFTRVEGLLLGWLEILHRRYRMAQWTV